VILCETCGCPSSGPRDTCAWCERPVDSPAPVSFVITRTVDGFEWLASGIMVAAASYHRSMWRIVDARGKHVVTLIPEARESDDDGGGFTLMGPANMLLGSIARVADGRGRVLADATASDHAGETMLVMRGDSTTGAHIVDIEGSVVALASWGNESGATDLLVTSAGTRQSLAMMFGLVLSLELDRHPRRPTTA
jgi:hypothetical protein